MNATTEPGSIPAKVSDSTRAVVTAGFAKLYDDVKKYAPVMYAPTAKGTAAARPLRTVPKITSSSPNVAIASPSQRLDDERAWWEIFTAGNENMSFARVAPAPAPPP